MDAKIAGEDAVRRLYAAPGLADKNIGYTVVRPGGLSNDAPTGNAILTEDQTAMGSVSREDVADLIVKQLDSPKAFQKIIACVDPTRSEGEAPTYAPFEC